MSLLEMLHVWWRLLLLRPVGLSIDITDRCPLSCAGCYMRWYDRNDDLPLERWEEIIRRFPPSERMFCAWTGGEPLLRADDIRALSRHFAWNWVATNGTVPIPDLPRTTVFVSVDGPEEIHDSLRGGWRETVKHVRPEHYVACTVRRENSAPEVLRELAHFWRGKARGVVFGFLTPRKGLGAGTLGPEERERVVGTLRELGRQFGGFILGMPGQVTDSARTSWGDTCPAEATLVTFGAGGCRKTPCTLGNDVDCTRCGCAVPGFLRRVRKLDIRTLFCVSALFRAVRSTQ
jgi:MoaA/NifB/PqqE/SkfB family radical SAM enzyme